MPERHKLGLGIWVAPLFSLVSLYFIFQGAAKVPLNEIFTKIKWIYILLGFITLVLIWVAKAFRMYAIGVGMGVKIKLSNYLRIYLATCFISHITPFNSGGTPLQIYLLHKQGADLGRATAITALDLGLNTMMFVVLIPVAFVTNINFFREWQKYKINSSLISWPVGLIIAAFVFILILKYIFWSKVSQWRWIVKLQHYLKHKGWLHRFQKEWALFQESWRTLIHKNAGSVFWAFLASIIYWFLYLLLAPLIFWAIGKPISFFNLIGWQLLFNFAQIFIPTPGGSGGSELLLLYLFKNLTGPSRVGVFVLWWKIYTFFSTLLIGSFYFWVLTKSKHKSIIKNPS